MQFGGQPTPWSEVEIEGLRLRSVSQILIQEIGAAGPENAEDSARRACGVIQRMADQIVSADARIAELEQSVTVRDTEIARMETDLELAWRDAERLDWFRTLTPHKLARIRAAFMPDSAGDVRATIDTARAGNGGGV